ncbi:MAG: hypothetical protein U1E62_23320 [Alsobacter sp.]
MPAQAHDPYTGLRSPLGQLCCGGDDCEATADFVIRPDGGVKLYSRRHQRWIDVDAYQITWMAVSGDGPAHWCGRVMLPNAETPSSMTITYCAFIDPNAF